MLTALLLAAPAAAVCALPGVASGPPQPTLQTVQFKSCLMGATEPFNIILPAGYSQSVDRYPVLYLLHGLFGHYNNWAQLTNTLAYAAPYPLIIVMPEDGNGWYTDGPGPHEAWESYLLQELIPYVDSHYRTIAARRARGVAGLSMGGYGALKFGIQHPQLFSFAASMSGAIVLGLSDQEILKLCRPCDASIRSVFGPAGSPRRRANQLTTLLAKANKPALPFLYLDCGTEDSLWGVNRAFSRLLEIDQIPHVYRERPGVHNWAEWNHQIHGVLRLLAERWHLAAWPE